MRLRAPYCRRFVVAGIALFACAVVVHFGWKIGTVSGVVHDATTGLPIERATVRIKATRNSTRTDAEGRFHLNPPARTRRARVTAWKEGFYVGGATARPWDTTMELALSPFPKNDHADYAWNPPAVADRSAAREWLVQAALSLTARVSVDRLFHPTARRLVLGCRDCHGPILHDQWASSAHARGAGNPLFLTLYNGTDVFGNRSPQTRRGYSRDYGSFALRPDPSSPYYGPGYKLDFPTTSGNCSSCHLPGAALEDPYGADPNLIRGIAAQGSHCDFCHKIAEVLLDPDTGLPRDNMPGVLSLELRRPGPEGQLFFGPYDDVDAGPDTYLPLMKQSEICAPCHYATFWGTPIYESFAEWRDSPYADRGETCQQCHMRPDGVTTNFAPGRGGVRRDASTIPTHGCPGASDVSLLQNAVTLEAGARRLGSELLVTVSISNDKTGHHVPTDSPLRQLILLVRATDRNGRRLSAVDGPSVPSWGGAGDPARGHYAGHAGKGFAKILEELWTRSSPTVAYWNPTRIVSDNRIAAFATDTSSYTFHAPDEGPLRVEVVLLFRRAFIDLMEQKGWDVPDIVMARKVLSLEPRVMS